MYNPNAITLGVVTTRSTAKRLCRSMRMDAILTALAQSCLRGNYARTELAVKC